MGSRFQRLQHEYTQNFTNRKGETIMLSKKLKGVVFGILILVSAVCTSIKSTAASPNDFTYEVISSDTVEIASYSGNESTVVIPEEAYGRTVVSIGENAFSKNKNLTKIQIPDTVTSIKGYAFNETNIEEFEAPKELTEIGDGAFLYCNNLKSVKLSDKLKSIGQKAFFLCPKLKSITIPSSVEKISYLAFGYDAPKEGNATYNNRDLPKIEDFLIKCYKGSAGEDYVIENGFNYEYLDAPSTTPTEIIETQADAESNTSTYSTSSQEAAAAQKVMDNNSNNSIFLWIIVIAVIIALLVIIFILYFKLTKAKSSHNGQ